VAPDYPKTKWIQIFGDPTDPPIPNVVTVSYDYYLGCYLSGLFAAHISTTHALGYIGGASLGLILFAENQRHAIQLPDFILYSPWSYRRERDVLERRDRFDRARGGWFRGLSALLGTITSHP
jgi:ABC transporter substrate-binding protein PnrA-like